MRMDRNTTPAERIQACDEIVAELDELKDHPLAKIVKRLAKIVADEIDSNDPGAD